MNASTSELPISTNAARDKVPERRKSDDEDNFISKLAHYTRSGREVKLSKKVNDTDNSSRHDPFKAMRVELKRTTAPRHQAITYENRRKDPAYRAYYALLDKIDTLTADNFFEQCPTLAEILDSVPSSSHR